MSDTPTRYRIDPQGILWQRVTPAPRTPRQGVRCLGEVVDVTPGQYDNTVVLTTRSANAPTSRYARQVNLRDVTDERAGQPLRRFVTTLPPIAGGSTSPPGVGFARRPHGISVVRLHVDWVRQHYPGKWVAIHALASAYEDQANTCSAPTLDELAEHLRGSTELSEITLIVAPVHQVTLPGIYR